MLEFLGSQPHCAVAMEACASAHYWGREIGALGHSVKLIPPQYAKPYVKILLRRVGERYYGAVLPTFIRRHEMAQRNETAAPAGAEHGTLYVAIEVSRKSWVVGIKGPASERIGLHSLGAADVESLRDLIEHQRAKAERTIGREVRVLCCYEAG